MILLNLILNFPRTNFVIACVTTPVLYMKEQYNPYAPEDKDDNHLNFNL